MMNACKWMEMLTLLQLAASICLIDEGSSSQALKHLAKLDHCIFMYQCTCINRLANGKPLQKGHFFS